MGHSQIPHEKFYKILQLLILFKRCTYFSAPTHVRRISVLVKVLISIQTLGRGGGSCPTLATVLKGKLKTNKTCIADLFISEMRKKLQKQTQSSEVWSVVLYPSLAQIKGIVLFQRQSPEPRTRAEFSPNHPFSMICSGNLSPCVKEVCSVVSETFKKDSFCSLFPGGTWKFMHETSRFLQVRSKQWVWGVNADTRVTASFVTWTLQFCSGSYKGSPQTGFCACVWWVCWGFFVWVLLCPRPHPPISFILDILKYKNITSQCKRNYWLQYFLK